ncbi:hypothetical protein PMAYCL1PPCAC_20480, partial [Pristionchus mayeri]
AAELCFVRVTSSVRRDALSVFPGESQRDCNVKCVATPGCEACMFYSESGTCILLEAARAPPPGSCPAPYECYEKRFSNCPVCATHPIDRGYTPGVCSRAQDVMGAPLEGIGRPCGTPPAGSKRAIDAILHDGTHETFGNSDGSIV